MTKVSEGLLAKLDDVKSKFHQSFNINDVDTIIDDIKTVINDEEAVYNKVTECIGLISQEINSLKDNIVEKYGSNESISVVTQRIETVTKSTENAANTIMDCCENIQNISPELENEDHKKIIQDNTTQIFEACNFQDLTGQHLTRVMNLVCNIEVIIEQLFKAFNINIEDLHTDDGKSKFETEAEFLMHGPAINGNNCNSQDEIDNLFNS